MNTYGAVTSCRGGKCGAPSGRSRWHAILGGLLILGGIALLADRAGLVDVGVVWDYWPLIPIALGAAGLLFNPPGERTGGFWLLTGGIYCAIGVWHLFDLSWATAWPIFFVAAGLQMLAEMVFDRSDDPQQREAEHVD